MLIHMLNLKIHLLIHMIRHSHAHSHADFANSCMIAHSHAEFANSCLDMFEKLIFFGWLISYLFVFLFFLISIRP